MKEEFLHFVWKQKLLLSKTILTTNQEPITVISPGQYNTNSGPDFLFAKIKIGGTTWVGHVEIHVKSSDWYRHNHEENDMYNPIVLHVVWEDDAPVYSIDNFPLPTLVIQNYIGSEIIQNYTNFMKREAWIPCAQQIMTVDHFVIDHWLERLFFERMQRKSAEMEELLRSTNFDFESVLFRLLAKNFGLKVNADAFFDLASSFDFKILAKLSGDFTLVEALFYGQARMLAEESEEPYHRLLRKEYNYLKKKHSLKPLASNRFQFFQMRPANFPTIRIAQLAALYGRHPKLFAKVLHCDSLENYQELFSVPVSSFWQSHFTFEKTSKSSPKKPSKNFVQLLILNVILPLRWVYGKYLKKNASDELFGLIEGIPPEKNNIIQKFKDIGVRAKNAKETQALLELKNNYCAKKRCLQCAIGSKLLKQ